MHVRVLEGRGKVCMLEGNVDGRRWERGVGLHLRE
jgi:hypothetical protein